MNHSDSEEMAGALLAAGCAEAPSLEAADLIVINTCAIREAAEQKVIGRMGALAPPEGGEPRPARRAHGLLGARRQRGQPARVATRRSTCSCARTRSRADRPPRPRGVPRRPGRSMAGDRRRSRGSVVPWPPRRADRLPATRADAVAEGRVARGRATHAWLPIIYGCDKTCTYCIVPFSRGPERSRPFDDVRRRGARPRATPATARSRCSARTSTPTATTCRPSRASPRIHAERTLGRRARRSTAGPTSRRCCARSTACATADGRPAIPRLRFVTSHPWDLTDAAHRRDGRVPLGLRAPPPAGPVGRRRRSSTAWAASTPSRPTCELVARLRAADPGHQPHDRRHRRVLRRDRGAVRGDARPAARGALRPGLRGRLLAAAGHARGTARRRRPRGEKRRRLNALLELQEGDRPRGEPAWVGRTTEVLFEEARPPRSHEHEGRRGDARRADRDPPRRSQPRAPARPCGRSTPSSSAARVGRHRSSRAVLARRTARGLGATPTPASPPARPASSAPSYQRDSRRSSSSPARPRPARPRSRSGSRTRRRRHRDHLRRLAPGLPRDGHRHGQGHGRRPSGGPASRPRPGRPRRALHRRRLPAQLRRAASRHRRRAADCAILVGGTGLYLRSVGRGLPLEASDADPAIRADLEARLADGGLPALVAELQAIASPHAGGAHRPREPASRRAGAGARRASPATALAPTAARLSRPDRLARPARCSRADRDARSRSAPGGSSPPACSTRPRACGRATPSRPARVQRVRLPRGVRRRGRRRARPRPPSIATTSLGPAPTRSRQRDVVPVASRHRWLDADRGPGERRPSRLRDRVPPPERSNAAGYAGAR